MSARKVPDKLWWQAVLPPFAGGAVFMIIGWANYISYTRFQYDFLSSDHKVGEDFGPYLKVDVYFYAALAFTALAIVGGFFVARAQLYVVRYGIETVGLLAAHASVAYKGMMKAVVTYRVEGREYEHAQTVSPELIRNLNIGDPVTVYVHPKHPKRTVVIWSRPPENFGTSTSA